MADVKFSELPAKGAPMAADDLVGLSEAAGPTSKSMTGQNVIDGVLGAVTNATDTVITATDELLFADVDDSNNPKKDTVQGILDLVPVPDLPQSYLAGMQLSNGTDALKDVNITAGTARDDANAANITGPAKVKQLDASWVTGTGNGGLSSSLSVTASTWYHVHAIVVAGIAEVGFDTSLTAANLVTDHAATAFRRIGSVLTDASSNIVAFSQIGDEFLWTDPPLDETGTAATTTAANFVLSVPLGLKILADIHTRTVKSGGQPAVYFSSPDVLDETPSNGGAAPLAQTFSEVTTGSAVGAIQNIRTNTSSEIRVRSTLVSTSMDIVTIGWKDRRGKDD